MGTRQEANQREQAKRIAALAESDPRSALSHLADLPPLLVADDVATRRLASEALIGFSRNAPLELRSTVEALMARLDDTDAVVRTNVLITLTNLARWYPQDLGDGTNLMVASLDADSGEERLSAAMAVSMTAYFRPDLVTPREAAYSRLRAIRETEGLGDSQLFQMDEEMVDGAIQALAGGDMASRPLEDDLVPSGKRAPLSKPARVGITALLWMPLAMASVLFWTYRVFVLGRRFRKTHRGDPSIADAIVFMARLTIEYAKHLTLLYPTERARLYVRRSPIATPTRLVPWFAGTTPTKADVNKQTPPYPDDWAELAALVRQRDGHQCRNCGALGGPRGDTELHVDHQTPRSRGGPDDPLNLRTLCRKCHEARHGRKFD